MGEIIDIVAIKGGHVVAMAYSDGGGPDDQEFIAEHPAPAYEIQIMTAREAADKHIAYLREIGFIKEGGNV